MVRRKIPKLVLTSRDREIFKFLFQCKIATTKDIQKAFFLKKNIGTTRNRLTKLYKFGYINRNVVERRPGKWIYACYLSKEGFKEMRQASPFKIVRQELKSDAPAHDLSLVRLKLKMAGTPSIKSWYSENELQSYQDLQEHCDFEPYYKSRTDIVIDVFNNDKSKSKLFGLEYEERPKMTSRIRDKFEGYLSKDDIFRLIYVSKEQSIQDKLMTTLKEIEAHTGKDKFYFATMNEILSAQNKFTFENINGKKMEFSIK